MRFFKGFQTAMTPCLTVQLDSNVKVRQSYRFSNPSVHISFDFDFTHIFSLANIVTIYKASRQRPYVLVPATKGCSHVRQGMNG